MQAADTELWRRKRPPTDPTPGLTSASVQERLKHVEESPDLDKDLKAKIADLYKGTLEQLSQRQGLGSEDRRIPGAAADRPRRAEAIQNQLDAPPSDPLQLVPENATLPQLEQKLVDAETALKTLQAKRVEFEAEPKRRRTELPGLSSRPPRRLKEVERDLSALPAATNALWTSSKAPREFLTAMHRAGTGGAGRLR